MMLAFVTSIAVPSLIFSTETVTQQPQGIVIKVDNETLKASPIAAGTTVATAFPSVSPSSCRATLIAPTVPPSATAIFALNVI